MSKKPAPSYDSLMLPPRIAEEATPAQQLPQPIAAAPQKKLMRDDAAPVTLYLHPQARKALKRYAMENDVKVHDLLLEAMEAWFENHGLKGPVRVQGG